MVVVGGVVRHSTVPGPVEEASMMMVGEEAAAHRLTAMEAVEAGLPKLLGHVVRLDVGVGVAAVEVGRPLKVYAVQGEVVAVDPRWAAGRLEFWVVVEGVLQR